MALRERIWAGYTDELRCDLSACMLNAAAISVAVFLSNMYKAGGVV